MFYLTAETNVTAQPATLARSKSLAKLADRLAGRDGEFWGEQGWDGITLESAPDHAMPLDDLKNYLRAGLINFCQFKELKSHCA